MRQDACIHCSPCDCRLSRAGAEAPAVVASQDPQLAELLAAAGAITCRTFVRSAVPPPSRNALARHFPTPDRRSVALKRKRGAPFQPGPPRSSAASAGAPACTAISMPSAHSPACATQATNQPTDGHPERSGQARRAVRDRVPRRSETTYAAAAYRQLPARWRPVTITLIRTDLGGRSRAGVVSCRPAYTRSSSFSRRN